MEVKEILKTSFCGRTQNYIFLKYEDKKSSSGNFGSIKTVVKSLKMTAYDLNINKVFSFEIGEFQKNYKLVTYKFIVLYDKIYLIYWEKDENTYTLYGNVYDENGQILTKRNKLLEINYKNEKYQDFYSINSIKYLVNEKIKNGKFVILIERFKDKGEIELEYNIFDNELNRLFSGKDISPVKLKQIEGYWGKKSYPEPAILMKNKVINIFEGKGVSVGEFLLSKDDNIITVYQADSSIITSVLNTKTKKILTDEIKLNNLTIKDSKSIINDNNELIITALIYDPNRKPKNCKYFYPNCLYYAKVDINTLELTSSKKLYFNEQMLNKLFSNNYTRFNAYGSDLKECGNSIGNFNFLKVICTPDDKLFLLLKHSVSYYKSYSDGKGTYYVYELLSYLTLLIDSENIINADATDINKSFTKIYIPCDLSFHTDNKFALFYDKDKYDSKIYYKIYDLKSGEIIESSSIPKKIKYINNSTNNNSQIYSCYFNEAKNMLFLISSDKNYPLKTCCNELIKVFNPGYINLGTIRFID